MNCNKQLKIISALMLILVIVAGCSFFSADSTPVDSKEPLKDYPKLSRRVKKTLKKRYHEEFEVNRIAYLDQIKVYVIYCNPANDKKFEFRVKTGGKYGEGLWDEYGELKTDSIVEAYYKPIIKKILPYKLISNPNFTTYTNWGRIPTAKELIKEDSENTKIYLIIYIFEDVMKKNKKRFLTGVLELINLLHDQNLKKWEIVIELYNEDFFKGIDPQWLMEETDWLSHDIYGAPEGVETDLDAYLKQRYIIYAISSDEYKKINNIKDIENRVWLND